MLSRRWLAGLAALVAGVTAGAQSLQQIGIGAPNSGTGDTLYTAFTKINANFTDVQEFLYAPIFGPVTIAPGTNTTVVGTNVITNQNLAQMPGLTIKCNPSSGEGIAQDCTGTEVAAAFGSSGGGGGSISLGMPAGFVVSGSPGNNLGVTYASAGAGTFIGSPCGGTGLLGLRTLCGADLPAITGPVTVTAGVSAITAGGVTLPALAQSSGPSILCNPTSGLSNWVACTKSQVNTLLGTSGGGSGGQSNILDICSYPGIDPTGTTDSGAALKAALATIAGTTTVGLVNCPIKIAIGYNPAAPIFVGSGTNLDFTPAGVFLVDNNTIGAFLFINASNITWNDAQIEYVGALALNNNISPVAGVAGSFNDTQIKAQLVSQGYTFSGGGSNLWTGPTNASAVLVIRAGKHLTFNRLKMFVPDGTNASAFIPVVASVDAEWLCCNVTTNSNPVNSTYAQISQDVNFNHPVIDGAYMGFVSSTGSQINITDAVSYRYSDLQNSGGGCPGASCNSGAGQYWFAPPHFLYLQNGDNSFCSISRAHITNTYDYGIYTGGATRRSANSGTLLSLKIEPTCGTDVNGYTSLRPDGFTDIIDNFPPNATGTIRNVYAQYNSAVATTDSTRIWEARFPSAGNYVGMVFDNWTLIDTAAAPTIYPIIGNGYATNSDVVFKGIKVFQNEWNGFNPGFQFGGTGISVDLEDHYATASGTGQFFGPIAEQGATYCIQCQFTARLFGWRQFGATFTAPLAPGATGATLNANWGPVTGSYQIYFSDGETRYATLTNGSAATGAFTALSGLATTAASGTGTVATVTFNGGQVVPVGQTVVISGITPSGYNGTQVVTASAAGSISFSSSATGSQTVAGAIGPWAVGNTVGGALGVNFNAYKPSISLFTGGAQPSYGSSGHIIDASNGYEIDCLNDGCQESFSVMFAGTPTNGSTNFAVPGMVLPTTMAVDRQSVRVTSALNQNFNVGFTGTPSALFSNVSDAANTNPYTPAGTFTASGGQVYIAPVTGSFNGTGNLFLSVRGTQFTGAQ